MKTKILMRIYAVLLVACFVITGIGFTQPVKVYAEEGEDQQFTEEPQDEPAPVDPEPEPILEPEPEPAPEPTPEPTPEPEPEYQPDPFDYNLICHTPSISFGAVNRGDVVNAKQFSIVNVGNTSFPLTWEEIDPYTAFDAGSISPDLDMDPGESVTFSVSPYENLAPGGYSARIVFFSANDIRRHHTAIVDLTVTVLDNTPYITSIDVTPGSVTLGTGKSYRFSASVSGGNNFDPSVTWSLTGNQSQKTTVDQNGTVTVGNNESAGSFSVIATSRQNPAFSDRAVINVARVDHVVTVKAAPSEGGAVAGGGSVTDGGNVSVSASANNNYYFGGWYEGNSLVSTSRQFTLYDVRSDRNLVAKFNRNTCYVKTSVNNADAGSVTKSASVSYGGKMTITAKANNGYRFKGFVENKKTISESSSIELNNITSDRDITAVFERITCKVNVYVNPDGAGKYTGGGNYYKGTNVELTTVAYDGYDFSGWSINGQIVSYDYRLVISNIQSDVNVTANFMKKNSRTFKVVSGVANEGGNISPSGESSVAEGGSITYNIVPASGYNIIAVAVDGKNIGAVASYTFNNIKENHSIAAAFARKTLEPAKGNGSGNAPKNSGSSTKVADTQAPVKKTTEYNNDTAAKGAVKESNVIIDEESVPKEATMLTDKAYAEDVYVEANDVEVEEAQRADTVMARHDLDEDTLRFLIKDKAVKPLLKEAYEDGTLRITVNNTYAADQQETSVDLYYSQPTLKNFEEVIEDSLSEEEVYAVLNGTPISFNIDIYENTATIESGVKKIMQSKVGFKPVSYFDFVIMKTSNGTTTVIDTTNKALEVEIPIPKQFQKKGRKFVAIRNHNGVVDLLDNVGDRDDSITFRTDRFSQYAIAYQVVSVNRLLIQFAAVTVISLILAVICYVNLIKYRRRARRRH
ncbi:MAG: Ig-like domain-containing protein [Butyrivibrio sp.]|nr:Ig-like domain-containing protein [Butyrivibrio sp.]